MLKMTTTTVMYNKDDDEHVSCNNHHLAVDDNARCVLLFLLIATVMIMMLMLRMVAVGQVEAVGPGRVLCSWVMMKIYSTLDNGRFYTLLYHQGLEMSRCRQAIKKNGIFSESRKKMEHA